MVAATVTGNVLAIPMVVLALTAARRILKSAEDLYVVCLEVTVSEETVTQAVAHGGHRCSFAQLVLGSWESHHHRPGWLPRRPD